MNHIDDTKQRLLDASRKLFADNGFDGASVRAITRRAGANLGAVTYHFGSKENLYAAVLEQLFARLADQVTAAAAQPHPARLRLEAIVHAFFAFFEQYPEAPRLMIRHLASAGAPPQAAARQFRRLPETIMAVVRQGQAGGEFRDVEPLLATFTLASQAVWFAVIRRTIAAMTGLPLDRPEMAAAMERHIIDVVGRTLEPAKAPA
ncbi:MAG TPA: TetR family transcriptional regulator [Gemmatimonadales bacterium]|nr:TetR family transcriptional regulator [Gemmatimonadales bacterium]